MGSKMHIFIGYDSRELRAYDVCCHSLRRRSSAPLEIQPLDEAALRACGLYTRPYRVESGGQKIDLGDGRPFSTDFAFTRFLVPALCDYRGWALFVDCDFLFLSDVAALFAKRDERFAVQCVKHDHRPVESTKMDGVSQGAYPRKNWSSLVLWNAGHPANRALTPEVVNREPGRWLHGFGWLDDALIGDLPRSWNWLAGISPPDPAPDAVHYTLGGPWFDAWQDVPFAETWRAEERDLQRTRVAAPHPHRLQHGVPA